MKTGDHISNITWRFALVEDNNDHAQIFIRRMQLASIPLAPLIRFHDGEAALQYLKSLVTTRNLLNPRGIPDAFFVDLHLPKVSGLSLLQEIRSTAMFWQLPVILMSSSSPALEMCQTLPLRADGYLTKPLLAKDIYAIMLSLRKNQNLQAQG